MDEMHRRISVEACLFATVVTLFVVTAWHIPDKAGVFQAGYTWPDCTWIRISAPPVPDFAGGGLLLSRLRHLQRRYNEK